MRHDGVDGGAKRVVLSLSSLKNSVDVRSVGAGNFVAVSVADEFSNDALEDGFLVGHQDGLESGQIAHLASIGQFHGGLNRDPGEFDFLGVDDFNVAVLGSLAANGIVVFKSKTQGINPGMTTGATLEFLVFEYCLADRRGAADIRLLDHHVSGWLDSLVVKILQDPRASVDR